MSRPPVLILGGTQFIGRATVEALLATAKYEITIVTRGRTPSPFDGDASVRHVLCDRRNGGALRALLASDPRPWYAVVNFLASSSRTTCGRSSSSASALGCMS